MEQQGEIILYQPDEAVRLEVRLEDETVWLTQAQMAELFQTTRNNITLHIRNIFKEGELVENSVCKESLRTAADGKKYRTNFYNLDVIISVGYRVKSFRGTQFRQWANKVLKDYLLKGYSVNQRLNDMEQRTDRRLMQHEQRLDAIDEKIAFFVRTSLPPVEGVFYDGQLFDAYRFATELIRSAHRSLVLIDNYVDESVLLMLSKRNGGVSAVIYTQRVTAQFRLDLEKHNSQYPAVEVRICKSFHDRFLIIDGTEVYHIGASLKDLGKRLFAFSKLGIPAEEILSVMKNGEIGSLSNFPRANRILRY